MSREIETVAVIGAGTIGASLTALLIARGMHVAVFDLNPAVAAFLQQSLISAMPNLVELGISCEILGSYSLCATLDEACADADFVLESAIESFDEKRNLLGRIDGVTRPEVVIATTTSSFIPSDLQTGMTRPERLVATHPFNPPHLVPLVEIAGGTRTASWAVDAACAFFVALGRKPIRLRREAIGHLANRLTAALYREAVAIVDAGIADVKDVDDAVRFGPGLRWAVMGPHMIYHLAAGDGGYKQYLDHLGASQEARWQQLGTPQLTPQLCEVLVQGVEREANGRTVAELRLQRDRMLVALLKATSAYRN
jgi:carnitine 3-dehydrogenase